MADLFALKCIYEEALFRNDEYVSPEKAKAIARMIEELCLEVRCQILSHSSISRPKQKLLHHCDMTQHHA